MQILLGFFIFLVVLTGLEIYLISILADFIGSIWYALAVIIATGLIGFFIARKNAKAALKNLLKGDFRKTPPGRQMFDAIAFFFAAALLILPGIITDVLGIILLFPFVRNIIYKRLAKGRIPNSSGSAFRDQNV